MKSEETVAYRLVDVAGPNIKTLFHGFHGSRTIPRNMWLKAERKRVRDGGTTWYTSGWHIFLRLDDAKSLLSRFKNVAPKAIVRCRVRGVLPKSHSPYQVYLANEMLVERIVWRYTPAVRLLKAEPRVP